MIAVITGDIVDSRRVEDPSEWLIPLKALFGEWGNSPESWEIYRGDSFQIQISRPEDALLLAIRIKAVIRSIKGIDVRLAVGVGGRSYDAARITESNGEAFINSGRKFESLKREKQSLAVQTPWQEFDRRMNLSLRLALIAMDSWTPGAAELMNIILKKPDLSQKEIGRLLGISQPSVSERQQRAHWSEIVELESLYRTEINQLMRHDSAR